MLHFIGDTHGEQARFLYSEEEKTWGKNDYIIVCGDWGFLFLDDYAEHMFLNDLEKRPYTLCFVDGNHENFHAIGKYPVVEWNGGKAHQIRQNIMHLMRGQVFTIEGKTIFTMGGAYSIDRHMRKLNTSYWLEEIPSKEEYAEAMSNLTRHNKCVDYIVTHTAPKEMILQMGFHPDPHDLELTGFLEYIMYEVQYKHWYCGHWHRDVNLTDKFSVLWYTIATG